MTEITRRNFLALSLATLALTGCGAGTDGQADSQADSPSPPDPLLRKSLLLVDAAGQTTGAFSVAAVGLDLAQQAGLGGLLGLLSGRRYADLRSADQQQFLELLAGASGFLVYHRTFVGGRRYRRRTGDIAALAAQQLGGDRLDVYLAGGSDLVGEALKRLKARRVSTRRVQGARRGRILLADALATILHRAFVGASAERALVDSRPDLFRAI